MNKKRPLFGYMFIFLSLSLVVVLILQVYLNKDSFKTNNNKNESTDIYQTVILDSGNFVSIQTLTESEVYIDGDITKEEFTELVKNKNNRFDYVDNIERKTLVPSGNLMREWFYYDENPQVKVIEEITKEFGSFQENEEPISVE